MSERKQPPPHSLVFGEVGAKLLELDERDKAYELFVLAGSFALDQEVITEPIKDDSMRENN